MPCPPSPSLCSPRPGLLRGPPTLVLHCVFPSFFLTFFFLRPTVTISKGVLGSSPWTFFLLSFSQGPNPFLSMVRLWVVPSTLACSCLTNVHTWLPSRTLCGGTVPSQHVSTEPHTQQPVGISQGPPRLGTVSFARSHQNPRSDNWLLFFPETR